MTLRRINIFLTVAKHLSYTRAAEELYLSQPAVSKNIQELEEALGVRLFNRSGNHISLTSAGELVYAYGHDIQRLVQNLQYELADITDELGGVLHIGASSTISQYLIPSAIAQFKNTNPQVEISLISGNTSEINTHLEQEVIDLGITEGDRKLNAFDYAPFMDDEIGFISASNGKYADSKVITEEQLAEVPLVIRETGSGTREVFEEAIRNRGIKLSDLNVIISLGSTESIKSFLLNADAVGVFSTAAIRSEEEELFHYAHIRGEPILRTFSFMTKQGTDHKLARSFIKFCKRHYNLSE